LGARLSGTEIGEGDDVLLSADRTPNAEGIRRLGAGEFTVEQLRETATRENVLVVLENDLVGLAGDDSVLDGFAAVVSVAADGSATADRAEVVLPRSSAPS
jgi:hypothetical protein